MQVNFTKMHGAGNDFVVLNETQGRLNLSAAQYRFLGNRHFGVGADQILSVRAAPDASVDFEYVIHNADGAEVEHCGNGSRCFVRYARDKGLTQKTTIRVKTMTRDLTLALQADGRVTVDMGAPVFDLLQIPFDASCAQPVADKYWAKWALAHIKTAQAAIKNIVNSVQNPVENFVAVLSMGNPHAVQLVDNIDTAPVLQIGPLIESHPAFPRRVNAGFMQIVNRQLVRLRVYERGAGETLACGTGACAAVVAGIRLGLLDAQVDVQMQGGTLTIAWAGMAGGMAGDLPAPVMMTGPAATVYEGTIEVPDNLA